MRRPLSLALGLLAAVPPLAAAAWIAFAAVNAPDPDTWSHLWSEDALRTSIGHRFAFDQEPRFLSFRLAYQGLLAIRGIDFALLAWVGFGLALLTGALLLGRTRRPRGWTALGLGLLLFSPAFGADWLQGERFRVMVPGFAFVAAALLLTRDGRFAWRFLGATGLATLAVTSTTQGMMVWPALVPLVAAAAVRHGVARPGLPVAGWIVLANLATLLTYFHATGAAAEGSPGVAHAFVREPRAAAHAILQAAGAVVPGAALVTGRGHAWLGFALLVAAIVTTLALLARRRGSARLRRAAPWIGCAILGLGQAAFAVDAVGLGVRDPDAIRELGWPAPWLAVGTVGLFAVATGRVRRGLTVTGCVLLGLLLATDWSLGLRRLDVRALELRGGEAQLPFYSALGNGALADPGPPIPVRLGYDLLRRRGLLRRAAPVASLAIESFPRAAASGAGGAGRIDAIARHGEVAFAARGEAFGRLTAAPPDLVLLTHRTAGGPDLVFRLARPRLDPASGLIGSRRFLWRATLPNLGFKPGDTVRAWGYFQRTGEVRAFRGTMRFGAKGRFRRKEATAP